MRYTRDVTFQQNGLKGYCYGVFGVFWSKYTITDKVPSLHIKLILELQEDNIK